MIRAKKAKELLNKSSSTKLLAVAENKIDNVIEYQVTHYCHLYFRIYEEPTRNNDDTFGNKFRLMLLDAMPKDEIYKYRKEIVKKYRDAGYDAKYDFESYSGNIMDLHYINYFEIDGFID